MANKLETCSTSCCPWGWLGKRFFGLSLALWLVVFAIVPHTARGVAWSVDMLSSIWRPAERVVVVEPVRAEAMDSRAAARRAAVRPSPAPSE